jgi:tetratricopeptide (TPR) repeat protein
MTFLSKLFGKKSKPNLIEKEQQPIDRDGLLFFKKGQQSYLNRQTEEALLYLEKSFKSGFGERFPSEENNLHDMLAFCLQELDYHYDAINHFDKSIALGDCNKYFSRSISKGAVLDYEGEIADLEKAIELSKIHTVINREYNEEARKQGYMNGAAGIFEVRLAMANITLDSEIKDKQRIENAGTSEKKQFWQDMFDERRVKKLSQVKKRNHFK